MKKGFILMVCMVLLVSLMNLEPPAYAWRKKEKGYTSGAYSEYSDGKSYFERVTDWTATVGKSKEEKALIRLRRRTAKRIKKARKAIKQKRKK